ncbi:MAG: hypothetical protein GY944_21905, partial [bacterium]|nr:hypothetical protein [bacterium]
MPWFWKPSFEVTAVAQPPIPGTIALLSLAAIALLAAGLIIHRYRRAEAPKAPVAQRPGRVRAPPTILKPSHVSPLIDREDERSMVWGVGRFASEDSTDRLDLPRTVSAIAASGGIASVVYEAAVYERQIWIWRDEDTTDDRLTVLAQEVERSLRRAGLDVRHAVFFGVPNTPRWIHGETFSPLIDEGHREHVTVLVFTEGRGLRDAAAHRTRGGQLRQLLNALRDWPRLAFVDFGDASLSEQLSSHGIDCIQPAAVPAFIGLGETQTASSRSQVSTLTRELRVWAACLALVDGPYDTNTALAVHHALDLKCPTQDIATLRSNVDVGDGEFQYSASLRSQLVGWLYRLDHSADSRFMRAIEWWRIHRERDNELRAQRAGETEAAHKSWSETQSAILSRLELHLLQLWHDPDAAAIALHKHAKAHEYAAMLARLRQRVSRSELHGGDDDLLIMPWQFDDLKTSTRLLLWRCGFARDQLVL